MVWNHDPAVNSNPSVKVRMPGSGATDQRVVWLSGQPWDRDGGTPRAMATAMAAHARILWVDPPSSPVTRDRSRRDVGPVLTEVSDQITRLTPVVLPGFTRPGVRFTTPTLMRAQVNWAMRKLGCRPSVVVMLYLGGLLGGWGRDVTNVFYGTDNYVAGAELMRMSPRYMARQERQALSRADMVVAVSTELARRWGSMGANTVVVPNGCWPIADPVDRAPAKKIDLPRPVVGLIGRLSDRIDFDVLDAITESGLSLLLMGPKDSRWEPARFRKLISKPSVRYVGPVPNAEVPEYLAGVDVGITPYRENAFNRASFPLKTLEYLSAGVPVVTSGLPAMRWLRADLEKAEPAEFADRVLVLAEGRQSTVNAIHAMAAADPEAVARRIAFARRHSWTSRAELLATEIGLQVVAPTVS
jgi:teichuronic acid biosynthesis glycosyltransferase TuaH